jgi:hypothetical protein
MTKKRKAVKTLKDPAAPKRPQSSFFLFAGEERPKVMAELGNISVGEVGKEMGRRWAVLDKDNKEKYETAHMEAKVRYEQEKKNYQPSQEFLVKKAEQIRKQQDLVGTGDMGKYFSFLQENWMKVGEEHQALKANEIQEIVWKMWCKDKGVMAKQKKVKKVRNLAEPKKPLSAFFIFQRQMRRELMMMGGVAMSNKEVLGVVAERWSNLDQDLKREYEKQAVELKVEYKREMEEFNREKSAED